MYVSQLDFSAKNYSEKTIVALQEIPEGVMGQSRALSKGDKTKLNKMYNCSMEY